MNNHIMLDTCMNIELPRKLNKLLEINNSIPIDDLRGKATDVFMLSTRNNHKFNETKRAIELKSNEQTYTTNDKPLR